MCGILLLALATILSGAAYGQFTSFAFTGTGTGSIPDGTATTPPAFGAPRTVSFTVSGLPFNVRNVAVSMDLSHSWIGDLEAVLAAPGGSPAVYIFSRVGSLSATGFGDDSDLAGVYTFADAQSYGDLWAAAASVGGTSVVPSGNYRASSPGGSPGGGVIGNFSILFAGLTPAQANGTWTLTFRDASLGNTGSVASATLGIGVGPTVTGLTPMTGSTSGGTAVVISGSNFDPAGTTVTFGGVAAAGLVTPTQIQVSSPPHGAGTVDVTVTTAYGSFTLLGGFTYTSNSGGGDDGDDGGCSTGEQVSPWWLLMLALGALALRPRGRCST